MDEDPGFRRDDSISGGGVCVGDGFKEVHHEGTKDTKIHEVLLSLRGYPRAVGRNKGCCFLRCALLSSTTSFVKLCVLRDFVVKKMVKGFVLKRQLCCRASSLGGEDN
jgi:hypothetical protein